MAGKPNEQIKKQLVHRKQATVASTEASAGASSADAALPAREKFVSPNVVLCSALALMLTVMLMHIVHLIYRIIFKA